MDHILLSGRNKERVAPGTMVLPVLEKLIQQDHESKANLG
jgi:hypothetical protein